MPRTASPNRPLWRLPADVRRRTALASVGRSVALKYAPGRYDETARTIIGNVVAVADLKGGGYSAVIVIRPHGKGDQADVAVSLATVVSIDDQGAAR